jgi:transcriptional regulator with XRE-family HTH domain
MEADDISQSQLAAKLGVTEGRVSQVMNNPGNLTLRKTIEYTGALGMKVAVIAYDDNDPLTQSGPINAEIFDICWQRTGCPRDFFALNEPRTLIGDVHAGSKLFWLYARKDLGWKDKASNVHTLKGRIDYKTGEASTAAAPTRPM